MDVKFLKRPLKQLHISTDHMLQKIVDGIEVTDEDLELLGYFTDKVRRCLPKATKGYVC